MNPSRWTVLVLVLAALGVSLAYGLRDTKTGTHAVDLGPLRERAALEPCPAALGPDFPKLTLPCLGGGKDVAVQQAGTGRPTLVNVYGSWCGPCLQEMPVLRAFHAKAGGRVALVGVDTQEQRLSDGLHFAIDVGQHWPALVDDERRLGGHFRPGVPLMLFTSPTGKVTHVASGGYKDLATLEQDVRTYLGVAV